VSATRRLRRHSGARAFTLVEVAVAIVIVGMGLVYILQALNVSKLTAAHTRNSKLARDLALQTLGLVESGVLQEDIARGLTGSYAEEGYPEFNYEVLVGDATFSEQEDDGTFDSWKPRTRAELEQAEEDREKTDEERQEEEQPYEKVKIRVTYPKIHEFTNELVLERWVPWSQVYGESEEEEEAAQGAESGKGTSDKGSTGTQGDTQSQTQGGK
jgi:prepilin-type N-terminal cleavage/methylation domain-containing protein